MAGFDSYSDKDRTFGSRGDWLINNGGSGQISYNGYHFPPALQSRVTVVPEYDRSERVVKWLTIAIEIRFIMTDPEIAPENVGTPGTMAQIQYSSMRAMLARLGQPGQSLYFDAQGLGAQFRVNDSGASSRIKDLDYGPKPQVTELQPLGGGNAFLVNWLCTTRVSPLLDDYDGRFVEFTYTSEMNVTNCGFLTRTINGVIEFPGFALSDDTTEQTRRIANDVWNNGDVYDANDFLIAQFPYNPWFERTYSYKFNESKRVMEFTITDVERETESWYPPGVGHFELKQNLSSDWSEGAAFTEWTLTYSGTIEASNGSNTLGSSMRVNKSLAWFWLWQIIKQRRNQFEDFVRGLSDAELENLGSMVSSVYDFTEAPVNNIVPAPELARRRAKATTTPAKLSNRNISILMYPLSINFTDDMYGNSVDFTIAYRVYCTNGLLIKGLNIFSPVQGQELQGIHSDTWVKYNLENANLGMNHKNTLEAVAADEILVDICNALTPGVPPGSSKSDGSPIASSDVMSITVPENGKDWDHYSNSFAFVEEHRGIKGTALMPTGLVKDTEVENDALTAISGDGSIKPDELSSKPFSSTLEGPSELYNRISTQVNTPTESTRYVIMHGMARRFSGPISPPKLLAVGDALAIQDSSLGLDVVQFETIKTGLSTGEKQCDVYVTTWKKYYVLDKVPVGQKLITTGIPRRFG